MAQSTNLGTAYHGLDYSKVLANLGGNEVFFVKLIRLFLEQHAADTGAPGDTHLRLTSW